MTEAIKTPMERIKFHLQEVADLANIPIYEDYDSEEEFYDYVEGTLGDIENHFSIIRGIIEGEEE